MLIAQLLPVLNPADNAVGVTIALRIAVIRHGQIEGNVRNGGIERQLAVAICRGRLIYKLLQIIVVALQAGEQQLRAGQGRNQIGRKKRVYAFDAAKTDDGYHFEQPNWVNVYRGLKV